MYLVQKLFNFGALKLKNKKCGTIEDAQQIRIDSTPLHCPICLSIFHRAPEVLPCGHSHCTDCLEKLRVYTMNMNRNEQTEGRRNRLQTFECPLCRRKIPIHRQRVKNYAIEAILDSLETYSPDDDPTNDIIAALNLSVKRLNLDKGKLENKLNLMETQLNSQRRFNFVLLSMLAIGVFYQLFNGFMRIF